MKNFWTRSKSYSEKRSELRWKTFLHNTITHVSGGVMVSKLVLANIREWIRVSLDRLIHTALCSI